MVTAKPVTVLIWVNLKIHRDRFVGEPFQHFGKIELQIDIAERATVIFDRLSHLRWEVALIQRPAPGVNLRTLFLKKSAAFLSQPASHRQQAPDPFISCGAAQRGSTVGDFFPACR